jgi:hypothetical protein
MMGVLGWTPEVVDSVTLKTLVVAFEGRQVYEWNHTAHLCSYTYNLMVMVSSLTGKSRMKPKSPIEFHPLLSSRESRGRSIGQKNFQDLRKIVGGAMGGR